MKTLNQIIRYTLDCSFSEEDWKKVLAYCKEQYKGGKIHKAKSPKAKSTYGQFIDWIDSGWGSGDVVGYGNTVGVVGNSTPDEVVLAAYRDYEGKLVINNMQVRDLTRLHSVETAQQEEFKHQIFKSGVDFHVRFGKFDKLYTPEKYFYVTLDSPVRVPKPVGMFLESNASQYHFLALLEGNTLKMDCWIDSDYTPLKPASTEDIKRLHSATSKNGLVYNERCHEFVKVSKKRKDNVYWYLNDRFELVMDRDNGDKIHGLRLEAGNYILDYMVGLQFMNDVKKLRGKN